MNSRARWLVWSFQSDEPGILKREEGNVIANGQTKLRAVATGILLLVVLATGGAPSASALETVRALYPRATNLGSGLALGVTLELVDAWVDGSAFPGRENNGVSRIFQELWSSYLGPAGISVLRFPIDIHDGDRTQSVRLANLCLWAQGSGVRLVPVLTSGEVSDVLAEDFARQAGNFVGELGFRLSENDGGRGGAYQQILYYQIGPALNHPALQSVSPLQIVRRVGTEIRRAETSHGLDAIPLLVGLSFDYELLALGAAPSGDLTDEAYGPAMGTLQRELRELAESPDVDAISVEWLPGSLSAGTPEDISRLAGSLRSAYPSHTFWISTGLSTGFNSQDDQSQFYAVVLGDLTGSASVDASGGASPGLFLREATDRLSVGSVRPPDVRAEEFSPRALSQSLLRMWSDPRAAETGSVSSTVQWWLQETDSKFGLLERSGGGFHPKEAYRLLHGLVRPRAAVEEYPSDPYQDEVVTLTTHDASASGVRSPDPPGVLEQEVDHLKDVGLALGLELLDAYVEKLRNKLLPEGRYPSADPDSGYGTYSGGGSYDSGQPAPSSEGGSGSSAYPGESGFYDDSAESLSGAPGTGQADLRVEDVQTSPTEVRAGLFNAGDADAIAVGAFLTDGYGSLLAETTFGTLAAGSWTELHLPLLSLGGSEFRGVRLVVYCDNDSNLSDNELLLGDIQVSGMPPPEGDAATSGDPVEGSYGSGGALPGRGSDSPDPESQREHESSVVLSGRIPPSLRLTHTAPTGGQEESVAARKIPLYSWYSAELGDNFATSDPEWAGQVGSSRVMGDRANYHFVRVEGYVFDPNGPQPAGTIPLYSWWSPDRGDAFLTTDPQWAGNPGDRKVSGVEYRFDRLEGFVYAADGPRPRGTTPLYSWYSDARGDNFATTDARWAGRPGETKAHGPGSGYRFVRIEGYLPQ